MIESEQNPRFLTSGDGFDVAKTPRHREVPASRRMAVLACRVVALLRIIFRMGIQDSSWKCLIAFSKVTIPWCQLLACFGMEVKRFMRLTFNVGERSFSILFHERDVRFDTE